jgi:hypothetical protein
MSDLGRMLMIIGLVMAGVGLMLLLAPKIPWLGRLPGDFTFRRGNFTFYFPLATSLVISVLLTLLFYLFRK